jgi:hypothetical protein
MASHTCLDCDSAGDGNCSVLPRERKNSYSACGGSGHFPTCGGTKGCAGGFVIGRIPAPLLRQCPGAFEARKRDGLASGEEFAGLQTILASVK